VKIFCGAMLYGCACSFIENCVFVMVDLSFFVLDNAAIFLRCSIYDSAFLGTAFSMQQYLIAAGIYTRTWWVVDSQGAMSVEV
jgi:hypothetical protein